MGLGMRMGMSGPTPTRYAADKPHNPSCFQGHAVGPASTVTANPTVVASAGGASIGAPLNTGFFGAFICCVVNTFATFG